MDAGDTGRADLDVLTFVASLAASMRDSQVAVIAEYLRQHVGQTVGDALTSRIKRHKVPGPEAFRQAMKAVPEARAEPLIAAAKAVLDKVGRDGDLDRGVLAMLHARKAFVGRHVMPSSDDDSGVGGPPPVTLRVDGL